MTRCSETCKMKKMQLEGENNKMRRELMLIEETKQNLEKQNRIYEHEVRHRGQLQRRFQQVFISIQKKLFQLRKYENELRNRDQSQNADMLRSALAVMQEKNSTLEKNLSAETRVKLDLFSALGEARRQLEIKDSQSTAQLDPSSNFFLIFKNFFPDFLRSKDKQLDDLKAKTAQLLAVMPVDTQLSNLLPINMTSASSSLSVLDQSDAIASFVKNSQLNAG